MPRHMRMRPDIPRQPVFVSRHMLLCRGMSRYVSCFTHVNGYSKELPRSTPRQQTYNVTLLTMYTKRHTALQLAWPAYWPFLPPCRRVLFGLAFAVASSAVRRRGSSYIVGACQAVLRRRTWHAVLSDVLIAPATGKGYWPWRAWHRCTLSMRDANIPPKAFLAKMPLFCRRSAYVWPVARLGAAVGYVPLVRLASCSRRCHSSLDIRPSARRSSSSSVMAS